MSSLRDSYRKLTGKGSYATRRLTSDGTLTGDSNMAVDGSTTPAEFFFQPEPGQMFRIDSVHLAIADNGNPEFDDYGNVSGPLINGCQFFTNIGGVKTYFDRKYVNNVQLMEDASDSDFYQMASNSRVLVYTARYAEFAEGLLLNGDTVDSFGFRVSDNLSSLLYHGCSLNGALFVGAGGL